MNCNSNIASDSKNAPTTKTKRNVTIRMASVLSPAHLNEGSPSNLNNSIELDAMARQEETLFDLCPMGAQPSEPNLASIEKWKDFSVGVAVILGGGGILISALVALVIAIKKSRQPKAADPRSSSQSSSISSRAQNKNEASIKERQTLSDAGVGGVRPLLPPSAPEMSESYYTPPEPFKQQPKAAQSAHPLLSSTCSLPDMLQWTLPPTCSDSLPDIAKSLPDIANAPSSVEGGVDSYKSEDIDSEIQRLSSLGDAIDEEDEGEGKIFVEENKNGKKKGWSTHLTKLKRGVTKKVESYKTPQTK